MLRLIGRALKLRCPRCGRGAIFSGYLRMNEQCAECGLRFGRESGFFLGSIYFNYGVTALVVTASYFILRFAVGLSEPLILSLLGAYCLLFPLWFFRYARALWLAFDQWLDPR